MNTNHAEAVFAIRTGMNNGLRKINELTPMTLADRLCLDAIKRDHQIHALNELLAIYKAPDRSLIDEYMNDKTGSETGESEKLTSPITPKTRNAILTVFSLSANCLWAT